MTEKVTGKVPEKRTGNAVNHDRLNALIHCVIPGAELTNSQLLTGGVSAEVHRLDLKLTDGSTQSLVLRAQGATHAGHSADLDYRLLRSLYAGGLPVPQPLFADVSGKRLSKPFLIMKFIEGTTTIPVGQGGQYIDRMADTLVKIHSLSNAQLPEFPVLRLRSDPLPEVFDFLPVGNAWAELRAHLHRLTDTAFSGTPGLLHGDFWPENLLWQQGTIAGILDWEDAALGDPLSDVACTRVELRYRFGKPGMERFTRAYSRHLVIDPQRLALWQVYVAAAAQRFMGEWGLPEAKENHMRRVALVSIREAGAVLMEQANRQIKT